MNYGFHISAAGVISSMHRQDIAANNLANITTTGFKADFASTIPREAARVEDNLYDLPSNALLERLGAGVLLAPTRTTFKQGTLEKTGNDLDIAINGNGFFGAQDGQGKVRLTRDGRLTLNSAGELVTASDGYRVLDDSDGPIRLHAGRPVVFSSNGEITQGGRVVAKLGFHELPASARASLKKLGNNLFEASDDALSSRMDADRTGGTITQHAIESSAVDPIAAMMAVQNAANAVTSNSRMLQMHDELMGRVINSLGRVT